MARVPTLLSSGNVKTGQVAASRTPPVRAVSAPQASFAGAEATAQAGQAISQGLFAVAGAANRRIQMNQRDAEEQRRKLEQKQKEDNHLWAESQFTSAQREWTQWRSDIQQSGSENVVEEFKTKFQKYQEDVLKTAPNEDAAARLKLRLDDLGTAVFGDALKIEAHNRVQNTVNTFTQMFSDTQDMVVEDPFTAGFPISQLAQNLETFRKNNRIPEETYQKMKEQVANLSAIQAEAAAATDPEFARMVYEHALDGVDWARRKAVLNTIERAEQTNDTLYKYEQQQLIKSHLDSIVETGTGLSQFNEGAYSMAFPKDQRDAAIADARSRIEIAKTIYVGRNEIKGKTPGELNQVLEKYRPAKDDPKFHDNQAVFEKLSEMADQQVKLFQRDPFSYSRQDPVVDRAWDLVENLPEGAKPELVRQLTAQALDASISYQRKAGVPEGRLSAMSQAAAAQFAQKINQGDTRQVQEAFGQLQATYGQHYPTAFRDLVRLPEGQRIDAAVQIVALHQGKPFLTDFLAAVRTKESDMKLENADAQQLRDRLVTSPEFMAFKGAMLSANPGAASMVDDYHHAIEKFATSILFRSKAKNATEAVKQATSLVIGSAYGFTQVGGTPVAVKRQQGNTVFTDEDISTIGSALKRFQGTIPVEKIDTSKFAFPVGVTEELKQKSLLQTIRTDTFWVTNPQNDGAVLYMNGAEGSTAPVKWKDGRQVEAKFSLALNYEKGIQRRDIEINGHWYDPKPFITGFYPMLSR